MTTDEGLIVWYASVTIDVKGINLSTVNYSEGYTMVDLGRVNMSQNSHFQWGVFNKTEEIKGIQLGLINCAKNGFLPCFPIINFAAE